MFDPQDILPGFSLRAHHSEFMREASSFSSVPVSPLSLFLSSLLFALLSSYTRGFPGGLDSKEYACNGETWVRSLGQEEPLEEGMATHSSIHA